MDQDMNQLIHPSSINKIDNKSKSVESTGKSQIEKGGVDWE
jgi:hypothetical protein